jgi:DNA-binding transcriptional MerR regulator
MGRGPGQGADKTDDIYRTIGDVAESLDLPAHVLRFWETRFKEIDPVKRAGGRRLYRPRDIELVEAIRHLLYREGYTIKGVQRILKEQGVDAVIADVRGRKQADAPKTAPLSEPAATLPETPAAKAPMTQASLDLPEPEPPELFPRTPPAAPPVAVAPPLEAAAPPLDVAPQRLEPATRLETAAEPVFPPPPMVRRTQIIDAPVVVTRRLDPEQAQMLRETLAEIEECKRLLALTKR